jgi:hypothetical protein
MVASKLLLDVQAYWIEYRIGYVCLYLLVLMESNDWNEVSICLVYCSYKNALRPYTLGFGDADADRSHCAPVTLQWLAALPLWCSNLVSDK